MAIKGLARTKAVIARKTKGYRNGVRAAVRETGLAIEFRAKMNAPVMIDSLIHGKIVSNQNGYGYAVLVNEMPGSGMMRNMPVYLEFGTGLYAANYVPSLPKEWQETARRYYINGKGTTKVHSFLYPAWNTEGNRYIDRVKAALKKVK